MVYNWNIKQISLSSKKIGHDAKALSCAMFVLAVKIHKPSRHNKMTILCLATLV
jgi:hypothetical protein